MSSVVRPPISGKLLRTFFPLCHFHYSQRLLSIWCVGCQAAVWITSVSNNLLRVAKNDAKESDISRMAVNPWKYLHPHTPLTHTHFSLSPLFTPKVQLWSGSVVKWVLWPFITQPLHSLRRPYFWAGWRSRSHRESILRPQTSCFFSLCLHLPLPSPDALILHFLPLFSQMGITLHWLKTQASFVEFLGMFWLYWV